MLISKPLLFKGIDPVGTRYDSSGQPLQGPEAPRSSAVNQRRSLPASDEVTYQFPAQPAKYTLPSPPSEGLEYFPELRPVIQEHPKFEPVQEHIEKSKSSSLHESQGLSGQAWFPHAANKFQDYNHQADTIPYAKPEGQKAFARRDIWRNAIELMASSVNKTVASIPSELKPIVDMSQELQNTSNPRNLSLSKRIKKSSNVWSELEKLYAKPEEAGKAFAPRRQERGGTYWIRSTMARLREQNKVKGLQEEFHGRQDGLHSASTSAVDFRKFDEANKHLLEWTKIQAKIKRLFSNSLPRRNSLNV